MTRFGWIDGFVNGGTFLRKFDNPASGLSIDWGDGTSDLVRTNTDTDGDGVNDSAVVSHTYAEIGLYTVTANAQIFKAAIYGNATEGVTVNAYGATGLIIGSAFNDRIFAGSGAGFISAGDGDDRINLGFERDDERVVEGGGGDDIVFGTSGGNDRISGGSGDDKLFASFGDDVINGGIGSDLIVGGGGSDVMYGGRGSDRIYGDDLDGRNAPGDPLADRFFFRPTDANLAYRDRIFDFDSAEGDRIDVSTFDGEFIFLGNSAFTGDGMEVRSTRRGVGDDARTFITFDVDGDRRPEMVVTLIGDHVLQATDFIL